MPCLWLRGDSSLFWAEELLPATPARERGELAGIGFSSQDPTVAALTAGKSMQAILPSPGCTVKLCCTIRQLFINTGMKPNGSALTSLKGQTQPLNWSISSHSFNPWFSTGATPSRHTIPADLARSMSQLQQDVKLGSMRIWQSDFSCCSYHPFP